MSLTDTDDEPGYCSTCAGSGEGMRDGSTCSTCKGSGHEPNNDDNDDNFLQDWEQQHDDY
ncbi:hypothetical protein ABXJ76_15065 [Methylobacter sp. G7]|uniref:hypothetical protein n=1 Tax=Methylobacter sp. G7 TaxID=3230117 RepID=UPI003D807061